MLCKPRWSWLWLAERLAGHQWSWAATILIGPGHHRVDLVGADLSAWRFAARGSLRRRLGAVADGCASTRISSQQHDVRHLTGTLAFIKAWKGEGHCTHHKQREGPWVGPGGQPRRRDERQAAGDAGSDWQGEVGCGGSSCGCSRQRPRAATSCCPTSPGSRWYPGAGTRCLPRSTGSIRYRRPRARLRLAPRRQVPDADPRAGLGVRRGPQALTRGRRVQHGRVRAGHDADRGTARQQPAHHRR